MHIDTDEWNIAKTLINEINSKSDYDVFEPRIDEVERSYKDLLIEHLSTDNQEKITVIKNLKVQFNDCLSEISREARSIEEKISSKENSSVTNDYSGFDSSFSSIGKIKEHLRQATSLTTSGNHRQNIIAIIEAVRGLAEGVKIDDFNKNINEVLARLEDLLEIYDEHIETKSLILPKPKYSFNFSEKNNKWFSDELSWYSG